MTETDKIAHARVYMEKLANGINPLTNQVVPDADLMNNVRISRCFFLCGSIAERSRGAGEPRPGNGKIGKVSFPAQFGSARQICIFGRPHPYDLPRQTNQRSD